MALAFLATKSWNPMNQTNQRALYDAEKKEKAKLKSELDKALVVKKERRMEEERRLDPNYKEKKRVNFLYEQPPGFDDLKRKRGHDDQVDDESDGLDAAARKAFSSAAPSSSSSSSFSSSSMSSAAAAANSSNDKMHHKIDERFNLEREAGVSRGNRATFGDMKERFEFLKGAPTSAPSDDVVMNIKPFGREIRNTKCSKCKEWGHQMGDRDCPMYGQLSDAAARQRDRDDPMPYELVALTEGDGGGWTGGGAMGRRRMMEREDAAANDGADNDNDDDNDDDDDDERRKRKKKKKEKKEKKEKKKKKVRVKENFSR